MWCLVVFQHHLHGQYLPHGKEKLLLKEPREEVADVRVHSHGTARNKLLRWFNQAYESQLRMNLNCPIETSEGIEPNDNGPRAKCGRLRIF